MLRTRRVSWCGCHSNTAACGGVMLSCVKKMKEYNIKVVAAASMSAVKSFLKKWKNIKSKKKKILSKRSATLLTFTESLRAAFTHTKMAYMYFCMSYFLFAPHIAHISTTTITITHKAYGGNSLKSLMCLTSNAYWLRKCAAAYGRVSYILYNIIHISYIHADIFVDAWVWNYASCFLLKLFFKVSAWKIC